MICGMDMGYTNTIIANDLSFGTGVVYNKKNFRKAKMCILIQN